MMWSICLQSRQGRKVITLPSSASTRELFNAASIVFGEVTVESLKGGFPPKDIACDESIPISSLLSNQERIQVEFAVSIPGTSIKVKSTSSTMISEKEDSAPSSSSSSSKLQQDQEQQTAGSRKSKRAAAKAATESMPALIKAQEDHIRSLQPSPNKKRARATSGSNFRSDAPSSSSNNRSRSTKPKTVALSATAGAGRRLADGEIVDNTRRATAAGRRASAAGGNKGSNTDVSEALLGALHDKGQMGVILRKGMKNAVQASYETTRAFSRLAAIQAQSYQLTNLADPTDTNTLGSTNSKSISSSSLLKVVYHGTVDKVKVEEVVDCIPQDVLKAVMEAIYASDCEALRPENLARLSPRVLWSCVHYYPNTPSIPEMYRLLLPHLDWKFLRRRATQLSEKAMENKRQAEKAEQDRNGGSKDQVAMDMDQALQAVAAVEHAMEHLQEYQVEERKARQSQAALARLAQQQQMNDTRSWSLVTPSEPDRDELRQCIESSLPPTSASTAASKMSSWITKLMKECHIHNWRELANITDHATIAIRLQVAEEHVQAWIDHAQDESVSEIMVELCSGEPEAVEILTERARTGTPKDLSAWRAIPELLLDQLRNHIATQEATATGTKNGKAIATTKEEWMNLNTIALWCDRAHRVLQDYEWLNWYATPIE